MDISLLFLPHQESKKRSILLRHPSLGGIAVFLLTMLFISHSVIVGRFGVLGYADNISVGDLLKDTNAMRAENGVKSLKLNESLSRAAKAKAEDMFKNNYWAHTSPTGKEPWDFIIASGYEYLYAGENLAVDFNNSDSVVEAWFESPSHRENLLNSKYTDIGFAVVNGELEGRKTTLIVQMFGYPRVTSPSVSQPGANTEVVNGQSEPPFGLIVGDTNSNLESQTLTIASANPQTGQVLNASDVLNMSRSLAVILGLFLTGLFALDGYYVHRLGILRLSGHTILHILVLVLAIGGIWYTSVGLIL